MFSVFKTKMLKNELRGTQQDHPLKELKRSKKSVEPLHTVDSKKWSS